MRVISQYKYMKIENFVDNESLQVEQINKFLSNYGTVYIAAQRFPRFRLVWSNDQMELRQGEYNIFYSDIFLKTEKGALLVPKYPHIIDRYIIEMWYPPGVAFTPELPNSVNGSYEVRYVFEDKDGNRLPLRMRVAEILMQYWFKPSASKMARISRDKTEDEKKKLNAFNADIDTLDCSVLQNSLHTKEAIIVPKELDIISPNLRNKNDSSDDAR